MANWYGATRTNYFKVNDEEKYQELFKRLWNEDDPVEDFSRTEDNQLWHAFGAYNEIFFLGEDLDPDNPLEYDAFVFEMGQILTPDSVFITTCVGNEKLRYLTGICWMIFPNGRMVVEDLSGFAYRNAERFFGPGYNLMLDY